MHYDCIQEGIFLARPNRFIAHVDLNGQTVVCHVKYRKMQGASHSRRNSPAGISQRRSGQRKKNRLFPHRGI